MPLQTALQSRPLPGGFVREGWKQLRPSPTLRDRRDLQPGYDFLAIAQRRRQFVRLGISSDEGSRSDAPMPNKARPDVEEYYPQ